MYTFWIIKENTAKKSLFTAPASTGIFQNICKEQNPNHHLASKYTK
jgi:hypothetical protein